MRLAAALLGCALAAPATAQTMPAMMGAPAPIAKESHRVELDGIQADFALACPRYAGGVEGTTATRIMLQWAAIHRPSHSAAYYVALKEDGEAACGADNPSDACLKPYEAKAHDFHWSFVQPPEWMEWSAAARLRLSSLLRADETAPPLVREWPKASVERRLEILRHFAERIRIAHAGSGIRVDPPSIAGEIIPRGRRYSQAARYLFSTSTVAFDRRHLARSDFGWAFSNLQHEVTHHVQAEIARESFLRGNTLVERLGLQPIALVYLTNMRSWTYLSGGQDDEGHARYEQNPVEVSARYVEADVAHIGLRRGRFTKDVADHVNEGLRAYRERRQAAIDLIESHCAKAP